MSDKDDLLYREIIHYLKDKNEKFHICQLSVYRNPSAYAYWRPTTRTVKIKSPKKKKKNSSNNSRAYTTTSKLSVQYIIL